jgi:hypothetical protein
MGNKIIFSIFDFWEKLGIFLFLVLKCAFQANNCHFGHINLKKKLKTN